MLAGADRYATSVALARAALAADAASPDEVLMVSGVTAVDALAAVGLAAARDSVVLLTEAESLPRVVRRFIDEQEFTQVTIVGGTAAVSDAVEDRLSRLETVAEVVRITGDDRFGTSAATATATGDPGLWCDTDERFVFMVGGSALADGVTVAPVATKMAASVLLNPADELHPRVASVLESQEVERVVVVGSEAEISSEVTAALDELEIQVTRVDGDSTAARSVALAKLVSGNDCEGVGVADNQFALVNGDAPAGAATLGTALASAVVESGDLVPVLLVGDRLPAEVAAHLGSVPVKVGSAYQDIVLHAVGGTAAVTKAVIDAAIEAGTTSEPIGVIFEIQPDNMSLILRWSDPIDHSSVGIDDFKLNGFPLTVSDTATPDGANPQASLVELSGYTLRPGDVFEIVADGIRGGQVGEGSRGNDNRTVGSFKFTVPGVAPDDGTRPRLEVIAPAGADRVRVLVEDANVSSDPQDMLSAAEVALTLGGTVLEVAEDGTNLHGLGVFEDNRISFGDEEFSVYLIRWGCVDGLSANCTSEIGGVATTLAAGDRVAITAGAVVDTFGNASRSTIRRVSTNSSKPALAGVSLTEATVASPAIASVRVSYDGGSSYVRDTRWIMWFRDTSDYAGAVGNDWSLFVLKRADTEEDGESPTVDVDVSVINARQAIQVVFDDEATAADIGDALTAELGDFMQVIEFSDAAPAVRDSFFNQKNINLERDDGSGLAFRSGETEVWLTLTFKEPLSGFDDLAFFAAQAAGGPFASWASTDGIELAATSFSAPSRLVTTRIVYTDASLVPDGDEVIVLPAGVVTDYDGDTNTERRTVRVRLAD